MSIQAFLLLLFLLLFPLGQQSFQFENCLYVETVLIFPTVKSGGNGWDGSSHFFFRPAAAVHLMVSYLFPLLCSCAPLRFVAGISNGIFYHRHHTILLVCRICYLSL
jgi:hypothetical protein